MFTLFPKKRKVVVPVKLTDDSDEYLLNDLGENIECFMYKEYINFLWFKFEIKD